MTDTFTKAKRSDIMSRIRSTGTKPEQAVFDYLKSKNIRFEIYSQNLPGKPDVIIKEINQAIFIHGCFWHHHKNCRRSNWPKSNEEYWTKKILGNIARDKKNERALRRMKWHVLSIWECQIKRLGQLKRLDKIITEVQIYKGKR